MRSKPGLSLALVLLALLGGVAQAGGGGESLGALKKKGEVVTAHWHLGTLPTDPSNAAWSRIEPGQIRLYPQIMVRPKSAAREPIALRVKALYNQTDLAIHLEWADGQQAAQHQIGRFPDAVAVQWPIRYGPGIELPYVGMGHVEHPVALWFWRADDRVETLAAEGFGSLTTQPPDGVEAKALWEQGRWRVVLKRSLMAPPGPYVRINPAVAGLVPFALAVWNGEVGQRDGDKFLAGWHYLHFEQGKVDPKYAMSLDWSPPIRSNPEVGKSLMLKLGCAACHSYPGSPLPTEIAPDLTYAGGVHRPDYLLESIQRPSAVIVPDVPTAVCCGPRQTFSTVTQGKRVSIMPVLQIPDQELLDLVEYLRTLR